MKQRLQKEDKAGLYLTIIFHLVAIIIMLTVQIGKQLGREDSFVLDFSKQEELEKQVKEEELKEDISKRIEDLLSYNTPSVNAKNIAVDARSQLKDDRNTDAKKLYSDAERLAKELKEGSKAAIEDNAIDEAVEDVTRHDEENKEQREYKGPSVLSYVLDGRKASHLSIPAYRCLGGGQVTVVIAVNNAGNVLSAKVMESVSSDDNCLRDFAVRAAKLSRFSSSATAPAKQMGEITYLFIQQ